MYYRRGAVAFRREEDEVPKLKGGTERLMSTCRTEVHCSRREHLVGTSTEDGRA